jgi:hypothetical protein
MSNVTTTNSKPATKTVGDPIDSYFSMRDTWDKARAVLNGQGYAKAYDEVLDVINYKNLLVPFSPGMAQPQFNFYKAEAELPGLVAQYAKVLVGGLLRKQPQMVLPDSVKEEAQNWITNSAGADGSSLLSLLDTAIWEELQTSRAWLLVDHPVVTEAEMNAMSAEDKKAINPYIVLLRAENVINWRRGKHRTTRANVLSKFTIRYYAETYTDNNPHHPELIDTVMDYALDKDGYCVVTKYTRQSQGDSIKVINGVNQSNYKDNQNAQWLAGGTTHLLMQGEKIDFIPAFPLNGAVELQEPILQPLIDREIGLYNKISRRNHLLYGAATYTPVISGNLSEDDQDAIVGSGLGSWIFLPDGGKADVLKTPSEALKDMESSITATIEEMARMGIRMLSPEGTSAESGVSLEIRNAAQTAQLGLLNNKISKTMQMIIKVLIKWKYGIDVKVEEIEFTLSQDFNPTPVGADWMRLVTEWYTSGLIPRSVWLSIGKHNDVIPTDYDDKKGQDEIMKDPLVATAGTTIDIDEDGTPTKKPGDAKDTGTKGREKDPIKYRESTTIEEFHAPKK